MKAMVLAAGEGTRLHPLTDSLPKPMIPIVGTPLLARTFSWLASQGVDEVAINLWHRPQVILDYFGTEYCDIRLHYYFEDTLRGTAGGVKAAEALFRDAPFFVVYGDNLIHADLRAMAAFHSARGGAATVSLFHHPNPTAAGIVSLDGDGQITRFVEKPQPGEVFSDLANAGVYVLDPSALDVIPPDPPRDFGRDIFPQLLAQGARLYGTPLLGYIQDTGTPSQYRQANWDMLAGRVGRSFDNPSLWLGEGVMLGSDVCLRGRNIIGNNVTVGDGATLTDCILWDDVRVGRGASLEGAILANDVRIADHITLPPGTILGAGARYE